MQRVKVAMVVAVVAGSLAVVALRAQTTRSAEVALKAAQHLEEVQGDLKGALEEYKKLASSSDRAVAARALLRMAGVYWKTGNPEAAKIYDQILQNYADQSETVALARARMEVGGQTGVRAVQKVFCEGCGGDAVADGSISRDGRWLATTDYGSGDIIVREVSTGRVSRLRAKTDSFEDWVPNNRTSPPGDSDMLAYGPLLSPDGQSVAYTWNVSGQSPRAHEVPTELRVIARNGGGPRTVLKNPEFEWSRAAAWSHDGRRILAVLRRPDKTWQLAWISGENGQVAILKSLDWRLTGGGDRDVSLSPDGRFIAYAALARNPTKAPPASPESTERHLYVLAADGSSETEVTKTTGIDRRPMWTSDGSMLLFESDRTDTSDLWALPMRDGKAAGAPSIVSRDVGWPVGVLDTGALLVLHVVAPVAQVIVASLDLAGGLPAEVRLTDTLVGARPSWSPDAKTLQFTTGRQGGTSFDIVLRAMDTGAEQLIPWNGARRPVEWLHDGTGFLTLARPTSPQNTTRTEVAAFYGIDPKREGSREVVRNEMRSDVAALASDGRTLYQFGRDPGRPNVANRLVAVDVATGRETVIRPLPAEPVAFIRSVDVALSPDGRTLAFLVCTPVTLSASRPGVGQAIRDAGSCRLGRVGVDGSGYREVFGPFTGITAGDRLAWTKDSRAILFASRDGATGDCWVSSCQFRLMRINADGGSPEFTGLEMNLGLAGTFSVSVDGSRVAFDTTRHGSSDLVALDLSSLVKKP